MTAGQWASKQEVAEMIAAAVAQLKNEKNSELKPGTGPVEESKSSQAGKGPLVPDLNSKS